VHTGVISDRLPVGELRIADIYDPLVRDLTDQLGWRRAKDAAAMRPADGELDHEIALARMTSCHVHDRRAARLDREVGLHRGKRYRGGGRGARYHAQIDANGRRRPFLTGRLC